MCTETIGFTNIRKIVDEHKLITAISWVSYELEMRVSRLRRLTCTASTFLKRFLPIAWVDLKSEYTDFGMRFLKKKNCEALSRSQSLILRWKFYVLFKIRCQACYQIFLDVCFLNLKFRTHKINLFACVLRAKFSPKISFLLLGKIWVAFDTSVYCNCFITYVILSNLWPNFHTHPYIVKHKRYQEVV